MYIKPRNEPDLGECGACQGPEGVEGLG
jgi:hypothetical protein